VIFVTTSYHTNLLSLTPSKAREYQTCPKQYRLNLMAPRDGDNCSPALSFGNSMHAALEQMHRYYLLHGLKFDCRELLAGHWVVGAYNDSQESSGYFERGVEALEKYAALATKAEGEVLGTELFLSRIVRLQSERVRLSCKVDRLDRRPDGHLEALDYKTNSNGLVPTQEYLAEDLGSFLYYALVRLTYPETEHVIVSQLNVLTLAKVEVEYDRVMVAAHKKSLCDIVGQIRAEAFEPRPGSACSWCRVRDSCPAFGPDVDLERLV
jgi:putative RecB family exonuclease